LKSTVDRITKAEIPLDVVYADIDYMERYKDFTTGKDVSFLLSFKNSLLLEITEMG
jgi:alpha-glucosidase (family GH31 glycosyl hydrolase)